MTRALIVVDVQVDFCEGGALGVDGGNAVAEQVAAFLALQPGYAQVVATRAMEFEQKFIRDLGTVTRYEINGKTLDLYNGDTPVLSFARKE